MHLPSVHRSINYRLICLSDLAPRWHQKESEQPVSVYRFPRDDVLQNDRRAGLRHCHGFLQVHTERHGTDNTTAKFRVERRQLLLESLR